MAHPHLLLPLALATAVATAADLPDLPTPPESASDWEPTGELGELLGKMAEASAASRSVFEPLTAEQMSWRPPNGTHTPRWNAEQIEGLISRRHACGSTGARRWSPRSSRPWWTSGSRTAG